LGHRGKAPAFTEMARLPGPANRKVRWHDATSAYESCGWRDRALRAVASAPRLAQPLNEVRTEPALAALRADDGRRGSLTRDNSK
jgi:hypothetical protein